MKPSSHLAEVPAENLDAVLLHPMQKQMFARLAELIATLRACHEPLEYFEFQKELFADLYQVEQRRSECAQTARRLRVGKGRKVGIEALEADRDAGSADEWALEEYIYARLARQLRTVGDGLAWRSLGFDRRLILALSRNSGAGPMFGKAGLPYELGRVEDLWRTKGHFALLHDLTNCLRIGDISEFTRDGEVLFHEVKATPHTDRKQLARLQSAVDAVMHGTELPGSGADARFVEVDEPYLTNLSQLDDLLQLAKRDGCRGMKLSQGRVITAVSLVHSAAKWPDKPEALTRRMGTERQAAIKRAGIAGATHHVLGCSADTASRSATMAPFSIYPFSPADCAALICDLLVFETVVSADALVSAVENLGLTGRIVLPLRDGELTPQQDVIEVAWRDRRLTVHDQALGPLLFELHEPRSWARGVRFLITSSSPVGGPVVVYRDEAWTWIAAP